MIRKCDAPGCSKDQFISGWTHFIGCLKSKFRGGTFSYLVFCPEHKERITSGGFDDGDPTTNPDLSDEPDVLDINTDTIRTRSSLPVVDIPIDVSDDTPVSVVIPPSDDVVDVYIDGDTAEDFEGDCTAPLILDDVTESTPEDVEGVVDNFFDTVDAPPAPIVPKIKIQSKSKRKRKNKNKR